MKGLLWLLVALNVLMLLAGVSGSLEGLMPGRQEEAPALDAGTAVPAGDVPRLTLLEEQATAPPGIAHRRAPALAPTTAPADDDAPSLPAQGREPTARSTPRAAQARSAADSGAPAPVNGAPSAGAAETTALAPPIGTATPMSAQTCFEAGPFAMDGAAAEEAEGTTREVGGRVLGREVHGSGPARHWVLIEGLPDRAAALREQERLRAAGYTDVMPVERGSQWGVSLGLFEQRSRAKAHRDAVRAAGFEAQLGQRRSGPEHTWLRVALTNEQRASLTNALPEDAVLSACSEERE